MEVLGIVIWPVLILMVCILFRDSISALIKPSPGGHLELSVGLDGVKVKRSAEAAASVLADVMERYARDVRENPGTTISVNRQDLATNLAEGLSVSLGKPVVAKRILWVDDMPRNNDSLVNAFRNAGGHVTIATSTDAAKSELTSNQFDLIITDMSRSPDEEAGLTLVKYLQGKKDTTPTVIYAANWAARHRGQEAQFGVSLITNDPSKVYAVALKLMTDRP